MKTQRRIKRSRSRKIRRSRRSRGTKRGGRKKRNYRKRRVSRKKRGRGFNAEQKIELNIFHEELAKKEKRGLVPWHEIKHIAMQAFRADEAAGRHREQFATRYALKAKITGALKGLQLTQARQFINEFYAAGQRV